ncbi:TPM domain-containing protein [Bacteroidota bacterium]
MKTSLSEAEIDRIRLCIERAELETSGEIVPVVIARSDEYEVVLWRAAAACAAAFLVVSLLIYLFYQGWSFGWLYSGIGVATGLVASVLAGAALVTISSTAFRVVAGSKLTADRVRARAQRAFIEEGVFRTRHRTGVLILVSLWERRLEVLPDEGVSAVVKVDSWTEVLDAARIELRRGDLARALESAVNACGSVLQRAGLVAAGDDSNELDDTIRIESK